MEAWFSMQKPTQSLPDPIKKFWDRYLKLIVNQGVKKPSVRWYVVRAERYIKAHSAKRLLEHTPEDVNAYFKGQEKEGRLKDWQFRQMVDAIRKLFEVLEVGLCHKHHVA